MVLISITAVFRVPALPLRSRASALWWGILKETFNFGRFDAIEASEAFAGESSSFAVSPDLLWADTELFCGLFGCEEGCLRSWHHSRPAAQRGSSSAASICL